MDVVDAQTLLIFNSRLKRGDEEGDDAVVGREAVENVDSALDENENGDDAAENLAESAAAVEGCDGTSKPVNDAAEIEAVKCNGARDDEDDAAENDDGLAVEVGEQEKQRLEG
jgi:hypothetical protein